MICDRKLNLFICILLFSFLAAPRSAHAWGKRGHSIVCQTAAYLTARSAKADFLKDESFDLGYYCNVPDLIWKKPGTYETEWSNHFMDLEVFDREFRDSDELPKDAPEKELEKIFAQYFQLDRLAFNAKFPEINNAAGRAWWRIRELVSRIEGTVQELKKTDLKNNQRHALQTEWLTTAGALGHYVGDLSQPLHVTENYDGQLSTGSPASVGAPGQTSQLSQKGLHVFFEDDLVNELFHDGANHLESDVMKLAEEKWNKEQKVLEKKTTFELLQTLSTNSARALPVLLATDKKVGRADLKKAMNAHRGMIIERLAEGSVYASEFFRRQLGWEFNAKNYHGFDPSPEFIAPPKAAADR